MPVRTRGAVLVADGEQRSALAAVRSLGRAGYSVYVSSAAVDPVSAASRYAADHAATADPLHEPARFVEDIIRLVDRWKINVLLPVSEAALLALLPERNRIRALIPIGSAEQFNRICDKKLVLSTAAELGIGVPEQVVLNDRVAFAMLSPDDLEFPMVVKPSRSVHQGEAKAIVTHALDGTDLRRVIGELPDSSFPVLLQRRIEGPGVGVFLLLWDDVVLASFCHRRLREKPPSGGVSVYRESIPPDAALIERSRALLDRLGWQGVAMVEYKIDHSTGMPYLMEINGRFWGSLQLAIDAGVDFPMLLVEAALGRPRDPVTEYRPFVRSRWLWGDIDHLIARMRHSPQALALPPGAPGRMRAVRDFIAAFATGDEVARRDDWRPGVREFVNWLHRR